MDVVYVDGGYAVIFKDRDDLWACEVYSHWDNIVPETSLGGAETREEALEVLDMDEDDQYSTPRERLKSYQTALESNCKDRGIPVPDKKPPLPTFVRP